MCQKKKARLVSRAFSSYSSSISGLSRVEMRERSSKGLLRLGEDDAEQASEHKEPDADEAEGELFGAALEGFGGFGNVGFNSCRDHGSFLLRKTT